MNLSNLLATKRSTPFLRGHHERRRRGRRAERVLVGVLVATCALQFVILLVALVA